MPKRRAVAILLFPVLATVFLTGWIFYALSEQKAANRQEPKRVMIQEDSNQVHLEMGLTAELPQEEMVAN